jgi:hypothetical protein
VNAGTIDLLSSFLHLHILAAAMLRNGGTRSALTRLPDTVLEQFRDEARPLTFHSMQADVLQSFPTNFRIKHPQLLSDAAWVDLDDLQEWLRQ